MGDADVRGEVAHRGCWWARQPDLASTTVNSRSDALPRLSAASVSAGRTGRRWVSACALDERRQLGEL